MKTAIVILNYNDYETTINYVNLIKNFKVLDLIIVVDNNSTDDSYEQLKKISCKNMVVLNSKKNGGYGYGNNIGIKYAIDKLNDCNIIISNPDIIIDENTIIKLSENINNKNIAIIAPVVKEHSNVNRGWKLSSGFKELLLSIPMIGTRFKNKIIGYNKRYYNNKISYVDAVSGCFFMIKSKAFKDINYFDENLFLYYEENIIASKLKAKGYKTAILNDCFIIHNHSVSIDKSNSNLSKYKLLKESQMYYLENYCKASKLSKLIIKLWAKIIMIYKG